MGWRSRDGPVPTGYLRYVRRWFLLSPPPRVQPQPPAGKPPLVCDPDPRETVPDPERAEQRKEPLSVSRAEDGHRDAGAKPDRREQGGHDAVGKGEIRVRVLLRRELRLDRPGRDGPLRLEQSIRQFHAAGRFRPDDDEADVVFLFPRPVSAPRGHGSLNTISRDFPRGNPLPSTGSSRPIRPPAKTLRTAQ